MRIAYVTETFPPEINGVSLTAERTLHHLREAGHAVQLVRPRQPGEAPRDDAQEWRCASGPIPRYPDLRVGLARAGALRARWTSGAGSTLPDLVHVATPGPLGWAALRAARSLGLRTAADFRTNFHAYSRHYGPGWLEPLGLRTVLLSGRMRPSCTSNTVFWLRSTAWLRTLSVYCQRLPGCGETDIWPSPTMPSALALYWAVKASTAKAGALAAASSRP